MPTFLNGHTPGLSLLDFVNLFLCDSRGRMPLQFLPRFSPDISRQGGWVIPLRQPPKGNNSQLRHLTRGDVGYLRQNHGRGDKQRAENAMLTR